MGELAGQALGRYQLRGLLGQGGMGVVYEAWDTTLRRVVALKVLAPGRVGDARRRARFLREAQMAAAVTGPEVVPIHEVGEADGQIFLAMELVRGTTLRGVMRDGLALPRALALAHAIARGLQRVHAAGVVHRDLKPENVLVERDDEGAGVEGAPRLTDFGLARPIEDEPVTPQQSTEVHTQEGHTIGTPGYMSPEQLRGQRVDDRSDIFSFGVLLYELVTGSRPYAGDGPVALAIAIERAAPPRASALAPGVPEWLDALLLRCLAREPAQRPSAAECVSALAPSRSGAEVPGASADLADRAPPAAALATQLERPRSRPSRPGAGPPPAATSPASGPGVAAPVPAGSRARRRAVVGAAVLVVVAMAVVVAVVLVRRQRHGGPRASVSPLAAPGSLLGCPPFAVGDPAGGWLGAAAAQQACDRSAVLRGGPLDRVLPPAELLDVPRKPSAELPAIPFAGDAERARAIAAARARAAAWLDGKVSWRREVFTVDLTLRDAAGRALGSGSASAATLWQAVRGALAPLRTPAALAPPASLDPEHARWTGVSGLSPDEALALFDFGQAMPSGVGVDAALAAVEALGDRAPALRVQARMAAALYRPGRAAEPPVALDRSSPARLATTAAWRQAMTSDGFEGVADELAALRAREPSALGRHALAEAEAAVRAGAGESEAAAQLLLGTVLPVEPGNRTGWLLIRNAVGRPELLPYLRMYAAWRPDDGMVWSWLASQERDATSRLELMRRAWLLMPAAPLAVRPLVGELVTHREFAEARAVASAAALGSPDLASVADELLVMIDAGQGRLGAALDRARRLLAALPRLTPEHGDLVNTTVLLAWLVGDPAEVADELSARFLEATPPSLDPALARHLTVVCAHTSAAHRNACFDVLEPLARRDNDSSATFAAGARAWADGDLARAVKHWRPLAGEWVFAPFLVNDGLFRGGEPDLTARLDEQLIEGHPIFNGAGVGWVGAAERLAARGNWPMARRLAQGCIDAWSSADREVPAVARLRALLARAPAAAAIPAGDGGLR